MPRRCGRTVVRMVEQQACQGCGDPVEPTGAAVVFERHLSYVRPGGAPEAPTSGGAVIIVQLCMPCAWKNMDRIERAIADALAAGDAPEAVVASP